MKTETKPTKIEWNIDPINAGEHSTGEVQIWADVPKETAAFIVRAVNAHEGLVQTLKFVLDALNVEEKNLDYTELQHIRGQVGKVIARAEGL